MEVSSVDKLAFPADVEGEEQDERGLQVVLDEISDAPSAADVVEILEVLVGALPTESVLEDFEDALAAQLSEPLDSLVGAMARKVCAAWKSLSAHQAGVGQAAVIAPETEAMALLEGYAALTQLQEASA